MRGLLTGITIAAAAAALGTAATAQRAPATFLPPSVGDEAFLENWFGAEFRSAGLKPLWPEAALRGYRARYRLLFAGSGMGATIVSIDVDEDGSGVVTSTRLRPGKMIEKEGRATYIPGSVMWEDTVEVTAGQIGRLRRLLDDDGFSRRTFRTVMNDGEVSCANGVSYLIEAHDRRGGYNVIMRDNCDYQEARVLIDSMMKLGGGWPRR
jgi:hypothetical protein